jgi:hypothetical protein
MMGMLSCKVILKQISLICVIDTIEIQALACLLIHIIHHEDAIKVEEK